MELAIKNDQAPEINVRQEFGDKEPCCTKYSCTPATYVYLSSLAAVVVGVTTVALAGYGLSYWFSHPCPFYPIPNNVTYVCFTTGCSFCSASMPLFTPPLLPPPPSPVPLPIQYPYPFEDNILWVFIALGVVAVGINTFSLIKAGLNQRYRPCNRGQWVCSVISMITVISATGLAIGLAPGIEFRNIPCPSASPTCTIIDQCSSATTILDQYGSHTISQYSSSCAAFKASYNGSCTLNLGC